MEQFRLLKNIEFKQGDSGNAQTLYADANSRVLRFGLLKGQRIEQFHPHSPVQIIVLKGKGVFEGKNGYITATPDTLLLFSEGEEFSVRAENEDLVFLALLHGSKRVDPEHAPVRG